MGGMVAAMGATGAAKGLFEYNRANYMYDREQRQLTEFRILEFRKVQAELWREDIRDITELTERKMDNYLIVNTLLLGMCLALFCEGRLEPGTPPWFFHFYLLNLGGAFMYLLMSVWFAMHASILAQSASVRILTQFVRLPVPTWEELESCRTYGRRFEDLGIRNILKLPFVNRAAGDASSMKRTASDPAVSTGRGAGLQASPRGPDPPDPWKDEQHGALRSIYELQAMPAALRRHVALVRHAALTYQGLDAFARVVMTFGINQCLHAIAYFCLGQIAHRSGSPWPAWCVVAILLSLAHKLVELDFNFDRNERRGAMVFIMGGPLCVARALSLWSVSAEGLEARIWVCVGFVFHGLWLLFAMSTCGIALQANGAVLPMKLRAVLYLDVFGWLLKAPGQGRGDPEQPDSPLSPRRRRAQVDWDVGTGSTGFNGFQRQVSVSVQEQPVQFSHQELNEFEQMGAIPRAPVIHRPKPRPRVRPDPGFWARNTSDDAPRRRASASGEMSQAPADAFEPESYAPSTRRQSNLEKQAFADHPSKHPARSFRVMTFFLAFLWIFGSAMPFGGFWHVMKDPALPEEHDEPEPPPSRSSSPSSIGYMLRSAVHLKAWPAPSPAPAPVWPNVGVGPETATPPPP